MPTERVLVEVITAANMAGVEEANAGFLKMNTAALAAGLGLAGLVMVGKSAISNAEAQAKATADLAQAYGTTRDKLSDYQATLTDFLITNSKFIADQFDVQAALANVVRSGLNPEMEAFRVLNDALDLAVIKHEAVSEAAKTITLAEAGNSKGLRDLGITIAEYNAIMKTTLSDADKHQKLLDLIETKTKNGRLATTELTQQQQLLNNQWQDVSERLAPALIAAQLDIATAIQTVLDIGVLEGQMFWGIATKVTQMTDSIISDIRRMIEAANAIPGVHIALPELLGASYGPGGAVAQGGRTGGAQIDGAMNTIAQRAGYASGQ